MKIEMIVCDRCAKPVPSGTGALVLVYGGADNAHLCENCLKEILPDREKTMLKLKGEDNEEGKEAGEAGKAGEEGKPEEAGK